MSLPASFLERPIAHRGLHNREKGIVENSRDAFKAAIDHGYGIECDLQLSHDGEAMVFHDYDMARLTGQPGPIQMRGSDDLAAVQLTDSQNRIEPLHALLDLVAGRVPLLIELKDQDGAMGPNIGQLEERVGLILSSYKGPAALMSFNPHSTRRLTQLCPDRPCGIVTSAYDPDDWNLSPKTCDHLREIPDFDESGACFISHEASDLARPLVAEIKAQGAPVLCWTIRSQSEADAALNYADNITFEGYLPT
ncbi:MAG: glycerophosphodiester phosphodiesterase family protein [Pseudomonadota bacterium]